MAEGCKLCGLHMSGAETWFTSDNEYENTFFPPVFTQIGSFTVHVYHSSGCSNQSDTQRAPHFCTALVHREA